MEKVLTPESKDSDQEFLKKLPISSGFSSIEPQQPIEKYLKMGSDKTQGWLASFSQASLSFLADKSHHLAMP